MVAARSGPPAILDLVREFTTAYPTIPSRSTTVMIVASIVATATSSLPVRMKPSAWQTEIVRPGPEHAAARDQNVAAGGGEEVRLELDAEHARTGRHEAERGVAAGAVQHGGNYMA